MKLRTEDKKMLPPIFLHGIDKRSGTNFLWRLLLLHPDCHVGSIGEDFFLKHAHLLVKYSENVFNDWPMRWQTRMGGPDALSKHLGESLHAFIKRPYYLFHDENESEDRKINKAKDREKDREKDIARTRLVTKTPSIENLDQFFKLFPDAHLIILVRDGRSVVFSGMKSFSWGFEYAAGRWAMSANKIHEFGLKHKDSGKKYIVLKYEDVFVDRETTLRKLFNFLELDCDKYDFEQATNLPVYGSSDVKNTEKKVHWKATKTDNFDPLARWNVWDQAMHNRFNWLAGDAMKKLGYPIKENPQAAVLDRMVNLWKDLSINIKKTSGAVTGINKRRL